ncbi:hypothetical protein CKO51_25820 [Rhodopirellula sp. SM50]|nr:hypothetical protein [Rhodopirellula sp. SM50]PAY16597.1 hypothetical protein CKO51_25820 [Rhodopirellula sp. SM50]
MHETQYTITVDTEEEWDWSSGYPTESRSVSNIQALPQFQEACDKYDAKVTYFVNHTVLADHNAAGVIKKLASHPNVEIGFHIHPWNTPPLADSNEVSVRESYLHNLPQAVAITKLNTVLEIFAEHGLSPTSFRGGRYSTCDWIQDHLYAHGCIADASILPFTTWPDDGAPDFRSRDLTPRRREIAPGKPGLWEIPLTLAFTKQPWAFWQKFYEWGARPPLRHLRCVGIAERLLLQRVWLNLEHPMGESMPKLLSVLRPMQLPCINFTMHSSSLVAGLNSYTKSEVDLGRLYQRLETVLSLLSTWSEFTPATVTAVAEKLEMQYHANSRN